jgi:hypothetical protein
MSNGFVDASQTPAQQTPEARNKAAGGERLLRAAGKSRRAHWLWQGRKKPLSPLPGIRVKLSTTVRNWVNVFFKDADER